MLKFKVILNRDDLKKFILHNMKIFELKFILPTIFCFLSSLFFYIYLFLFNFSLFYFLIAAFFLFFFIFRVLKFYSIFKKVFIKNLDIVGKEREFFVDERSLTVSCENDFSFCGRYFFYNLKEYKIVGEALFLFFNKKVYIIIPLRFLKEEEKEELLKVLDKNLNWNEEGV